MGVKGGIRPTRGERNRHNPIAGVCHRASPRSPSPCGSSDSAPTAPAAAALVRKLGPAAALAVCLACVAPASVRAQDLLLFPRALVEHTGAHAGQADATEWLAATSVFYSTHWRQLRGLAELNLVYSLVDGQSKRESEFERAQIGWQFDPSDTVWIGRYHTPIGYWNTAHHHGAQLQTSITRPRIVEFEDDGGVLPMHYFGLLLQGIRAYGEGSITYDLGAASGPTLRSDGLEPVKVVAHPHVGKPSFVGRLAWRPDAVAETDVGAFAADSRIPVDIAPADEIEQVAVGSYASLDLSPWRLLGVVHWVRNASRNTGSASRFVATTVQAEYRTAPAWVLFTRHEATASGAKDPYLARFPDFPKARTVAGVRFEVTRRQALTFEIASHKRRDSVTYLQSALQWSAVAP